MSRTRSSRRTRWLLVVGAWVGAALVVYVPIAWLLVRELRATSAQPVPPVPARETLRPAAVLPTERTPPTRREPDPEPAAVPPPAAKPSQPPPPAAAPVAPSVPP